MTLQQIYYALTIEECGSMNKAAEKLYIVQSTLTNAVRELEKEAGFEIFLRTHKGVIPTAEGREFLHDIRMLYKHYDMVLQKYEDGDDVRREFGVSTQHYSFAVDAFVQMVKNYDVKKYSFAIRETTTKKVIEDVASLKSEVGVLYISNLNKNVIRKLISEAELEFTPLIKTKAYVYLWKGHPLSGEESISLEQLEPYPCLSFEQEEEGMYYAEEILSEHTYPQTIKACDRGTMLNLMMGLNGYTLCSGIISDEINGSDHMVVPFREDEDNPNSIMEIGYLVKKNAVLSKMGECYIEKLKEFLDSAESVN